MSVLSIVTATVLFSLVLLVLIGYWERSNKWGHVVLISVSYLIFVVLAMQEPTHLALPPVVHHAANIMAHIVGTWALWTLVRTADDGETG